MKFEDFKPTDSTGPNDNDVLFRSWVDGPQGAKFELFRELHHTNEDIEKAKAYLRRNFDVVSIHIIRETK
jgi:hypothetical protein